MSQVEQQVGEATDLESSLADFQRRFNESPRVGKLIKKWDRKVFVEATDTDSSYTMYVEAQEMRDVLPGPPPDMDDPFLVHLQATEATLVEIFSGRYNPSTALLDGVLSVFSNERDKVKLEAIAMVIWALG